jgi:hypothetical protein
MVVLRLKYGKEEKYELVTNGEDIVSKSKLGGRGSMSYQWFNEISEKPKSPPSLSCRFKKLLGRYVD